ncbi:tRNA-guanine transglycosylase, partial [bacterium]|nr:tRNA-guanine transglycosylase [bacterium]
RFMAWDRPILTDSGGFQVFSLADRCKMTEKGVVFSSHIDGSRFELTPESAMSIQQNLGADVAMCLDHCPKLPAEKKEIAAAEKAGKLAEERARLVDLYRSTFANPYKAAELGYIDEVIEPKDTRRLLIQGLRMLEGKRERGPARKHGNIPL